MLKRIAVADLRVGMYIHEFCGAWTAHPFWRSKFLLNSPKDLERIKSTTIAELWIDVSKGLDVQLGARSATPEQVAAEAEASLLVVAEDKPLPVTSSMEEEVRRAYQLCERSREAVIDMFTDARMGRALHFEQADDLVSEIASSVRRHPDALISLARLKTADEYTFMHSVAVCALMIALARQLELDEQSIREAGLAGLLHDIGKMSVADAVLNKPGKLTDTEFGQVRLHPEAGARLLAEGQKVSERVVDVCLHHHEKVDGSGYPHRLVGDQISLFARMGAVCDVYDAITSNRPYKKGWDPAESIRKMAEWTGHFDRHIFQAFVKAVGIYPVGSLVRLQSGAIGVVIEQKPGSLLTPKVKIFFSSKSRLPIAQEVIDLSKYVGREKIVSRECAKQWGFRNIDQLWNNQAAPGASA
ncbi:HD-GYP domain-containing protein [Ectopseudomonas mendocina]|uniref:HD-GYP domain-containing protein n=1 Tax=Ectopseudomonas mendocina TaxID=300 RepID=A0ABZ2RH31_ECTME